MAKQIHLKFNDNGAETEYTLEFTRASIKQMESSGFDAHELVQKPMSTLPALFAGAFLAHHRLLPQKKIDAIFDMIPDKQGFFEKLAEMYNEPIEALMAEPDEAHSGNVNWGANW